MGSRLQTLSDKISKKLLRQKVSGPVLLMIEILHDLEYKNPRHYNGIVYVYIYIHTHIVYMYVYYMRSCGIYIINSGS